MSGTFKLSCPSCQEADSRVLESRPDLEGIAYYRSRRCELCGARFVTEERLSTLSLEPHTSLKVILSKLGNM